MDSYWPRSSMTLPRIFCTSLAPSESGPGLVTMDCRKLASTSGSRKSPLVVPPRRGDRPVGGVEDRSRKAAVCTDSGAGPSLGVGAGCCCGCSVTVEDGGEGRGEGRWGPEEEEEEE